MASTLVWLHANDHDDVQLKFSPRAENKIANQVVLGGYHSTCAVTMNDVELWCWGRNNNSQLGDGGNSDSETPTHIDTIEGRLSQIALLGGSHSCVVMNNNHKLSVVGA